MKVQFFAYYRDIDYAGCKEVDIPAVATLRDVGNVLGELYGNKFKSEFFSPDMKTLGEKTIVLINGRRVEFLDGLDTKLVNEDVVMVFPVVAGG